MCIFVIISDVEHLYIYSTFVCPLSRNIWLGVMPTFDWAVCFPNTELMSCLYTLEINPLSVVLLAIVFSHSKACLLTLFIFSFAMQKLLSLIRSHLFIFVFISITLGRGSNWILLCYMLKECTAYVYLSVKQHIQWWHKHFHSRYVP